MPLLRCHLPDVHPKLGDALFDTQSRWYHTMLVVDQDEATLRSGETVRVAHMRPPLDLNAPLDKPLRVEHHRLGTFDEIDDDDRNNVADYVKGIEIRLQSRAASIEDYSLSYHGIEEEVNAPGSGTILRASCASFLEDAYQSIRVDLVDEGSVPTVSFEELCNTLRISPRLEQRPGSKLRELRQALPAPVLLPAYQMRAFEKPFEELPHQADRTDHPYT